MDSIAAVSYFVIRWLISLDPSINNYLSIRPEIDVPTTNPRDHYESYFLWSQGLGNGVYFRALPLTTLLYGWIHKHVPWMLEVLFIGNDLARAFFCTKIAKSLGYNQVRQRLAFVIALLNPFFILPSLVHNLNVLCATLMIVGIYFLVKRSRTKSIFSFSAGGVALGMACYGGVHNLYFLYPVFNLDKFLALNALSVFSVLILVSEYLVPNSFQLYRKIFMVHWGRPNLGMAWYLFLEMFVEYRSLYLVVFALMPLLHLPALTVKFSRHASSVLLVSTLILLAIFKPYPNMADYALWMTSFITLLPQSVLIRLNLPFLRNFFTFMVIFVTVFGKRMWERWMWQASSNANFYFNCGLVWNVMQMIVLTRLVWAGIKWKVVQEHSTNEKVLGKLNLEQE